MTIRKVELSDKFHIWVAATNQIINEMNNNVVLEARQKLKTVNKTTLVDSINELYDNTAHTDSDTDMDHNFSANVITGKIKLQTGSDTHGNSYIEFWDDTLNVYRKLVYNHLTDEWYVENKQGVLRRLINEYSDIDGNNSPINVKYMSSNDNEQYIGKLAEFVYTTDIPNLYIHDGHSRGGNKLHMTDSKVKINDSDPSSGYLSDKIKGGNGVNISVSDNVMYINDDLYGQFPTNPVANNYLKRNATNGAYVNVDAAQIKTDIGLQTDLDNLETKLTNKINTKAEKTYVDNSIASVKASLSNSVMGAPIYTSAYQISAGFIAPSNGYLRVHYIESWANNHVQIDGVVAYGQTTGGRDYGGFYRYSTIPIRKGSVVNSVAAGECLFVPSTSV